MEIAPLPIGQLVNVSESLRALSDHAVAKDAIQCVVVLMVPGSKCIELRAFGAGADSDRAHVLLGLAARQIEEWFVDAI